MELSPLISAGSGLLGVFLGGFWANCEIDGSKKLIL